MDLNTSSVLLAVIIGGIVATLGGLIYGVHVFRSTGAKQIVQLDRIELLVDGRYGDVLQRMADMAMLIAKLTGDPADMARAEGMKQESANQDARVKAAKGV